MKFVKLAILASLAVGGLAVIIALATDTPEQQAEREAVKAAEQATIDQAQAEKDAAKRAKVKAEQDALESLSDEQAIAKAARSAFGDSVVKSVTYVDGVNVAMIAIDEPIAVSADMSRKQFLLAVRETIKEIADIDGLAGVDVRWKDGDMRLLELRFEGEAVARAAKATHVDDLTTIAKTYWAHSGF